MPKTRFTPVFILPFLIFLFALSACKDRQAEPAENLPPETLSSFISGYTSGVIGRSETVKIQFPDALAKSDQIGQEVDNKIYSISPSFNGSAVWENARTLVLIPDEAGWEQGSEYLLTIDLTELYPDAEGVRNFTTSFTVRQTQLSVNVEGLYTPDPNQPEAQRLNGTVIASDGVDQAALTDFITVTQNNRKLPVSYAAEPGDDRLFSFTVDGVKRGEKASEVKISWDATKSKGIGDAKGERSLPVTASNNFQLLTVEYKADGDPHVELRFSDPVSDSQDLTGLIRLGNNNRVDIRRDVNIIRLYLRSELSGSQNLQVSGGLKNSRGNELGEDISWQVNFSRPAPQLRAAADGAIMPHSGQRLFPFEAIGLEAVRVEVFRIYAKNVQQYLMNNSLDGQKYNYGMSSVGRIIHQERIPLKELSETGYAMDDWNHFAVDLSRFIDQDDQSIYQVRIGYALDDARKDCGVTAADFGISRDPANGDRKPKYIGFDQGPPSILGNYYGIYRMMYDGFDWEDRDDPCKPAYYNSDRFLTRNIISSNLGLIVKQNNDRQTVVLTTDLISGGPASNVKVTLYDQQQQLLEKGTTDVDGRWLLETDRKPIFVVAEQDKDVAYLRLNENNALNTSRFNTGGRSVAGGVKGTFYTERGVWRPGDSVYLNFVLENRLLKLPSRYPINFTLTDVRGNVRDRRTVTPAAGQIYPLYFATADEDPTGNWTATVKVGGQTYRKSLKIETIKPNRLKIDLRAAQDGPISPANDRVLVEAAWLHGAPAAGLTAEVRGQLQEAPNLYEEKWPNYDFSDPARALNYVEEELLFEDGLDAAGKASFSLSSLGSELPGPLRMAFNTRVYEPGGNFSSDNVRLEVSAYDAMAGLSVPTTKWGSKRLPIGEASPVSVAAIDPDGKGLDGRNLSVGLYRVTWRYWWQDDNDNVSRFNSSSHEDAIETYDVTTSVDGRGQVSVTVPRWGRYLLRVCDTESGHCSGDYFYAGSPRWTETDKDAAAMLPLRMEDREYAPGESTSITLSSESGGMVLLTLENGEGVIDTRWIEAAPGESVIPIQLDERMVPNVYASVMLIQPHAETINKRPIRQYGIIPIRVVDPETRLEPTIATATEYEPEQNFSVTVAEADGQSMNYTLAIVDEGLLGLTRFKTPDLWNDFFAKEALPVRTYDLYNQVISSMDGKFNRILAVGGGDADGDGEKKKANRFEPVVMHLGPFSLAAGAQATHDFTMPNYVGAVRVMVVAEGGRNYGKASESIPVRKDLMILPTLPRVIGPGETMELPVNVFAMTGKVKNANISVTEESGLVDFKVAKTRAVSFSAPGDQLVRFPFQVGQRTGVARFVVKAEGNGIQTTQEIEIDVRNPNPLESRSTDLVLAAGESKTFDYNPFGDMDSREATLEVSTLPPLNLDRHLRYLIRYPYGCAEQTTGPAFAQVNLDKMVELTDERKKEVQNNVRGGIDRLVNFQTSDGGMGYWPGASKAHPWASNYILHFFLEAEAAGYTIPISTKDRLIKYQQNAVANWRSSSAYDYYSSTQQRQFDHAYRLFTLALANKADLGAMNRLRSGKSLNTNTRSFLAAAYALTGKASIAGDLLTSNNVVIEDYRELGYTFGSSVRDRAILLSVYGRLGMNDRAGQLALRLARDVGDRRYLNTQEAAFVITAFTKYAEISAQGSKVVNVDYVAPDGGSNQLAANSGLLQIELPTASDGNFTLRNNGNTTVYATTILSGKPLPGEEVERSNGIELGVSYEDLDGNPLDVSNLTSGTDFIAVYNVAPKTDRYRYYQNMALQQIAASGWEINNERMGFIQSEDDRLYEDGDYSDRTDNSYRYQDYRDAQVNTFFNVRYNRRKEYRIRMTAAYPGRYYLPSQLAEAMYDPEVMARTKGQWVTVE
ncbi:hypothetical protein CEQ90_10605 [Lewinellaceae bacterium SD302]|nr:hypothetical protein CEQ90_10605 [Lewinellaceae bacterium SD302]